MKHKFLDFVAIIVFPVILLIPIYVIWGDDIEQWSTTTHMLIGLIVGLVSGCCYYKFMKRRE